MIWIIIVEKIFCKRKKVWRIFNSNCWGRYTWFKLIILVFFVWCPSTINHVQHTRTYSGAYLTVEYEDDRIALNNYDSRFTYGFEVRLEIFIIFWLYKCSPRIWGMFTLFYNYKLYYSWRARRCPWNFIIELKKSTFL